MDEAEWNAKVLAGWRALMARATEQEPEPDEDAIRPLPAGMRALLLAVLALGYPAGVPQTRLHNAPDAAIAWQVQSMLDDYADYDARHAFAATA